ncbi:MAG: hypothetical protein V1834_01375 [Candidatus Micrarchaeota archaeon]
MKKLFLVLVIAFLLVGCAQEVEKPSPVPSPVVSPTQQASPSLQPTAVPTPGVSPSPTAWPSNVPFPSVTPDNAYCIVRIVENTFTGPKALDVAVEFFFTTPENATIDCGMNSTTVNVSIDTNKAFTTCDYTIQSKMKKYTLKATTPDKITCNQTVTIAATKPPVINQITATVLSSTSALVEWATDRDSTSKVEYGIGNYNSKKEDNATLVTEHAITLETLTSNSTYQYKVTSCDANSLCTTLDDLDFKTPE